MNAQQKQKVLDEYMSWLGEYYKDNRMHFIMLFRGLEAAIESEPEMVYSQVCDHFKKLQSLGFDNGV
tara:strand:+ start:2612 stop:2812 length:201 start_codon:yes stop_codon:yes gene_type:complete